MDIEQFISIDTNQTIMEEADTLMEEYEQQKLDQLNQRMAEMEASNKELLEAIECCCLISKPENHFRQCPNYVHMSGGGCWNLRTDRCCIWATVDKVKGLKHE